VKNNEYEEYSFKEAISQIKTDIKELKGLNAPFYKVKGASVYLGLSERRVYSLISDGDIAYYKNKQGKIRFSRKQLDDYETYKEFPVNAKNN
jgi:excisionase family DNA binding protein